MNANYSYRWTTSMPGQALIHVHKIFACIRVHLRLYIVLCLDPPSPIDLERDAGYGAGRVRRQVERGPGDIVGRGEAAQGDAGDETLLGRGLVGAEAELGHHRRAHGD